MNTLKHWKAAGRIILAVVVGMSIMLLIDAVAEISTVETWIWRNNGYILFSLAFSGTILAGIAILKGTLKRKAMVVGSLALLGWLWELIFRWSGTGGEVEILTIVMVVIAIGLMARGERKDIVKEVRQSVEEARMVIAVAGIIILAITSMTWYISGWAWIVGAVIGSLGIVQLVVQQKGKIWKYVKKVLGAVAPLGVIAIAIVGMIASYEDAIGDSGRALADEAVEVILYLGVVALIWVTIRRPIKRITLFAKTRAAALPIVVSMLAVATSIGAGQNMIDHIARNWGIMKIRYELLLPVALTMTVTATLLISNEIRSYKDPKGEQRRLDITIIVMWVSLLLGILYWY